jgi:type I restriction enzyme, S subunit
MSRIYDLIKDLAPKGVPIQPLGQVGVFIRGRRFTKADQVEDGLPSIHYGEIYTHYGVAASETHSRVRSDLARTLRFAQPGDVIIAGVGETVEDVGKAVAWLGTEPVAVHDDCFIFRSSLDPKFVVYFMQSDAFNKPKEAHVARAKVKRVSSDGLAKLRIPVPPIEVQREIVRVLDLFSGLTADLTTQLDAELEGRQLQYSYYRDNLFISRGADSVPRVPIGELGEIFRGKRFTKADYVPEGGVACIHYGEIYTDYGTAATHTVSRVRANLAQSLRFAHKGDVVLTDVGETVEDVGKAVAWLGDEDAAIHDHCYVIRSSVNPVYLSYYMQTAAFRADKDKHIARTKVKTLLLAGLKRIEVPVPSQDEQERIVSVLDKFKTPIADLGVVLPGEINARRKQYEYYRDRLLTFKELAA